MFHSPQLRVHWKSISRAIILGNNNNNKLITLSYPSGNHSFLFSLSQVTFPKLFLTHNVLLSIHLYINDPEFMSLFQAFPLALNFIHHCLKIVKIHWYLQQKIGKVLLSVIILDPLQYLSSHLIPYPSIHMLHLIKHRKSHWLLSPSPMQRYN